MTAPPPSPGDASQDASSGLPQKASCAGPSPRAACSVQTLPLWRIRLAHRLTRSALVAACCLVALVCLHALASSQRAQPTVERQPTASPLGLAGAGFASEFARAYLSWNASDPEAHRHALDAFTGSSLALEGGLQLPLHGSRQVQWDLVVQERDPRPSLRVYTVAVDTKPGGIAYLAVSVKQLSDGRLALASYPSFVGAPAITSAQPVLLDGSQVDEPELEHAVQRALRNYLAPAPEQLAADLAPGAKVSTPPQGLRLESVQRIVWGTGGHVLANDRRGEAGAIDAARRTETSHDRTLVAVIEARGAEGAQFTLAYEVEVRRLSGRWEIVAIEIGPDA